MLKSRKQKRKKKHLRAYERRLIARVALLYFAILIFATILIIFVILM